MRQVVLAQHDAVRLEISCPMPAGFDQPAAGDSVLPRNANVLRIELAVIEHQRPLRPLVAQVRIVPKPSDWGVQAVVEIAVIEAAAPSDAVQRRARLPQAV